MVPGPLNSKIQFSDVQSEKMTRVWGRLPH